MNDGGSEQTSGFFMKIFDAMIRQKLGIKDLLECASTVSIMIKSNNNLIKQLYAMIDDLC